jgi:hypothetical protein
MNAYNIVTNVLILRSTILFDPPSEVYSLINLFVVVYYEYTMVQAI